MRLKEIAILAVQEARMKTDEAEKASEENPGILFLINGEHSNKLGTLFAINLAKINATEREVIIDHNIIIPNRAQEIKIKWGDEQQLNLLNVYAPNEIEEKTDFLETIGKHLNKNKKEAICMLGDFNCVERAIDRSPAHKDAEKVIETIKKDNKNKKTSRYLETTKRKRTSLHIHTKRLKFTSKNRQNIHDRKHGRVDIRSHNRIKLRNKRPQPDNSKDNG
jgi:exonuclease III